MPQPPGGAVFWSPTAQQFYQQGHVGAVSRLVGIESLHVTESATGPRYYDAFGTRVPNPGNLIPQSMREKFVGAERTLTSREQGVYEQRPGEGKFYKTWFTFRDLEGAIHLGYLNHAINTAIDNEVERAKMIRAIGDQLNLDPTSEQGGSKNISDMITSVNHFLVE